MSQRVRAELIKAGRAGGGRQRGLLRQEMTPSRHGAQCGWAFGCGLLGSKGCKGAMVTMGVIQV